MQAIVDLLTSGNPWLVFLGIVLAAGGLAGVPMYYYIREIKRQRDNWKDRWEKRGEKLEEIAETRREEIQDYKDALGSANATNETLRQELRDLRDRVAGSS